LKRGIDVLVATPGRLLDFMSEDEIKLDTLEILVLDEVDRMLDMGFLPQVRKIVEKCPKKRQTLFFSATMPPEIESMTQWVLKDPEKIEIGIRFSPAETVTHALYPVAKDQKFDLLLALLDKTNYESVLIFCSTKVAADKVTAMLKQKQHSVVAHA
jgi:ATP-dependent RNA helicase RhlE